MQKEIFDSNGFTIISNYGILFNFENLTSAMMIQKKSLLIKCPIVTSKTHYFNDKVEPKVLWS